MKCAPGLMFSSGWRAGSVLVAVLVILVASTLIAATVLVTTRAGLGEVNAVGERSAVRGGVRSGLRATLGELHEQRDALLRG